MRSATASSVIDAGTTPQTPSLEQVRSQKVRRKIDFHQETLLENLDLHRLEGHYLLLCLVANFYLLLGMGLFKDAYDLFRIPPIMQLIGQVYFENEPESREYQIQPAVLSTLLGIALLGTVIGQLVLTGRFILGFGIGGDYPLSATIMSEFANKRTRGAFIAAVFSMQGFGILAASTVTMVVCAIFDHVSHNVSKDTTPMAVDFAWRLILMLGAVPAGLTCYWQMTMPVTARYTALVEQNVLQAAKDMEKVLDVPISQFIEENPPPLHPPSYPLLSKQFFRRHGRDLFSCAASWFLVDVVFYSSNLFQSQIYNQYVSKADKVNAYQDAFNIAKLQAIVAICSTIPGYWVTVCFIDRIGRLGKWGQLLDLLDFCGLRMTIKRKVTPKQLE
ncbi:hypothetical protein SO802_021708 [Lithocarpus litseifolius]|uniref:Uncharacterized protein n=1 Tax=Lithocarpus litseifolius TaxID=425828 RepID=A0AAW2CI18_9ROSI